jgi:hypothetical protein
MKNAYALVVAILLLLPVSSFGQSLRDRIIDNHYAYIPTDHVQEVLGRPPESFETAARRYIAQPDLIAPGLRVGTKLEALAFMVKMMLTRAPDPDRWARDRGHPILRQPLLAHDSRDWREAAEQKDLLLLPTSRAKGQQRSYSQEQKKAASW